MKKDKAVLFIALFLSLLWRRWSDAWAGDQLVTLEPAAEKVLRNLSEYFTACKSFSVDVSFNADMGLKAPEAEGTYSIAMKRPGRLLLTVKESHGEERMSGPFALVTGFSPAHAGSRSLGCVLGVGSLGNMVACDGKRCFVFSAIRKQYSVMEAGPGSDAILAPETRAVMRRAPFFDFLLRDKPYEAILEGVEKVTYAGQEKIGDVQCHRLSFAQRELDWDIWVSAGERPLLQKVAMDPSKTLGGALLKMGQGNGRLVLGARFENWQVDAELNDTLFDFKPPDGAIKVDSLLRAERAEMEKTSQKFREEMNKNMADLLGAGPNSPPRFKERAEPAEEKPKPWKVIEGDGFVAAVPRDWRDLKLGGKYVLYLNGDGIALPKQDETGAPLRTGLMIERYPGLKETAEEGAKGNLATFARNPSFKTVKDPTIEKVALADGTESALVTVEFVRLDAGSRNFNLKLFARDKAETGWVVTAWLVGDKDSNLARDRQEYIKLLRAYLTSFCFDGAKFTDKALGELPVAGDRKE